jgi:hypothetical protein
VGGLCHCSLQHGREENAVEVDPVAGSVCGIRGCCDAEPRDQRRAAPRGKQGEAAAPVGLSSGRTVEASTERPLRTDQGTGQCDAEEIAWRSCGRHGGAAAGRHGWGKEKIREGILGMA